MDHLPSVYRPSGVLDCVLMFDSLIVYPDEVALWVEEVKVVALIGWLGYACLAGSYVFLTLVADHDSLLSRSI